MSDEITHVMKEHGFRAYMVERYLLLFGEKGTLHLLNSFLKPPVPSVRVNTNNINAKKLAHRLEKKGYHLEPVPWCKDGFWIFDKREYQKTNDMGVKTSFQLSPGATHEIIQGYYSMQGSSSMIPALLLDPRPNDEVLDMAAAPGSKFVQMAQLMDNKGLLIGLDRIQDRTKALKSNVQRCGVKNSILICQDARYIEESFGTFDKILLDAPCTGEGLMGSDPTRRYSRTVDDIEKMMGIQIELLDKAASLLNSKGRIVYSTCSLAPEENEHVVNEVLKKHGDLRIAKIPETIGQYFDNGLREAFGATFHRSLSNTLRVYPYHHVCRPEGFFAAIIEKK